jgi:hypothetical protein
VVVSKAALVLNLLVSDLLILLTAALPSTGLLSVTRGGGVACPVVCAQLRAPEIASATMMLAVRRISLKPSVTESPIATFRSHSAITCQFCC